MTVHPVFVLDNGGYTLKAGFANSKEKCRLIPNCITKAKSERRRQFIGDQVDDCKDISGLFYILAFQKGYLVNWDVQKAVWDYVFGKDVYNINWDDTSLIFTEPYFNFSSIQDGISELFFEEYGVNSLLRTNSGTLSNHHYEADNPSELCCLVVDVGYSFIHIAPYCKGERLKDAIVRIDVGGKLLTNHMKDIISYRQLHVMDETYVINQVKEDACFVSTDFLKDMEIVKKHGAGNTILRDYVLPDYTAVKRGYMKSLEESTGKTNSVEQIIRLGNERFAVPELLFHPSDIGIPQMGLSEAIVHSIAKTPEEMHPHFYRNILLTGGCALFAGLKERVSQDVRSMACDDYDVNVYSQNPVTYAWEGGVKMGKSPTLNTMMVSRKDYEEIGIAVCQDRFNV